MSIWSREYKEDQSPNSGEFLIKFITDNILTCIAGTQGEGFTAKKR
jgi:hypothetical protein